MEQLPTSLALVDRTRDPDDLPIAQLPILAEQQERIVPDPMRHAAREGRRLVRAKIRTSKNAVKSAIERTAEFKKVAFELESDYATSVVAPPHLTLVEANEREITQFCSSVFSPTLFDLENTTPFRVRVGWRLIREMSRLKGGISDDELLASALVPRGNYDPWTTHTNLNHSLVRNQPYNAMSWDVSWLLTQQEGLPLLPPEVPKFWRTDNGWIKDEYDPTREDHDPKLHRYIEAIGKIITYLGIERGSEKDPDAGIRGIAGLLDPELVRLAFPSRTQIMAWEDLIIQETVDKLVRGGMQRTQNYLRDYYGLAAQEIASTIKMAKTIAQIQVSADVEQERALMSLQLENFILRARKSFDLKAELGALKQQAIVKGINKSKPEDMMDEFIDIVRKVSARANGNNRILTAKATKIERQEIPEDSEGESEDE